MWRKVGHPHDRRSQRAAKALGEDIGKLLPGVHRIAALAKRWLLSTHQGAVHIEHLPAYLDEFCFRFNRRRSRSRGLVFYRVLQLAIGHDPVRYQQLIARSKPKTVRPAPPGNRGHPPSLDRPAPDDPGAIRPDETKSAQMDSPERMIAETTDGSAAMSRRAARAGRGFSDAATVGRRRKCSIPATPPVVHQRSIRGRAGSGNLCARPFASRAINCCLAGCTIIGHMLSCPQGNPLRERRSPAGVHRRGCPSRPAR